MVSPVFSWRFWKECLIKAEKGCTAFVFICVDVLKPSQNISSQMIYLHNILSSIRCLLHVLCLKTVPPTTTALRSVCWVEYYWRKFPGVSQTLTQPHRGRGLSITLVGGSPGCSFYRWRGAIKSSENTFLPLLTQHQQFVLCRIRLLASNYFLALLNSSRLRHLWL